MTNQTIIDYVKAELSQDKTGHAWDHIERVVANCRQLLAKLNKVVDEEIVITAAYVHDCLDDKLFNNPEEKEVQLKHHLLNNGLSTDQVVTIIDIIKNQSFSANLTSRQALSLEGQVLQDADRLDALGAIGIARTFYYAGAKGNPLYNQSSVRTQLDKAAYRQAENSSINHFYEKLLKLENLMNTEVGKNEAHKRTVFMQEFLSNFYQEIGQAPSDNI
ncbi:HD domain-containing protein [Eremococcus coleocola]|uniref:HD domain protein n=1 Tax=Eremococcus coleocola ACS-139-V-Col8 TaxID=908337 RepID=E4KQW9_9LACT|nr:HD domain-containing protein [Eremococcus coleocola]EFR30717.1 HD domain protein [Eremococcus coleocola ACS-139-V-Col8]